MKIIILGAGEVGYHLASKLYNEGHDISVIDNNSNAVQRISNNLDILAIKDSCLNAIALQNAGIHQADLVIGVTYIDEINLVSCLLSKHFDVPYTIARVRDIPITNGDYRFPYEKLGVDQVIHPERAAALDIIKLTKTGKDISRIMDFAEGKIRLMRLDLHNNKNFVGKKLSEISEKYKKYQFLIILVVRHGENYIPSGDFIIKNEDQLYLLLKTEDYDSLLNAMEFSGSKNKRIMIAGGNAIGLIIAQELEKQYSSIKIIEENEEKCRNLAEHLKKTLILQGDSTEVSLLLKENIQETDVFIATSDEDKNNLLAGLLAKNNGAKKTICIIRRPDYISLVPELGIDHVIAPRVSVTNEILGYVRTGKVMSMTTLPETEAEIIEQEITNPCLLTSAPLKDLTLPPNIILGGIINQDNEVIIPSGKDQCSVTDHVILVADKNSIKQIEELFKKI